MQSTLFHLPPPISIERRRVHREAGRFDHQVEIDVDRLGSRKWSTPPIVDANPMPATRGDCEGDGLCVNFSCRYNIALRVKPSGAIKVDGGGPGTTIRLERRGRESENRRLERMADAAVERIEALGSSCALDFADRGPMTVDQTGAALGVTAEIVRIVTNEAIHGIDIAEARARRHEDREQQAAAKAVLHQIRRKK